MTYVLEDFESGTVDAWDDRKFNAWDSVAHNGTYSGGYSGPNVGTYTMASYYLPTTIDYCKVWYRCDSNSAGGGYELVDDSGNQVCAAGNSNPNWVYTDVNDGYSLSGGSYDNWISIEMAIDERTWEVTYTFTDPTNSTTTSETVPVRTQSPPSELRVVNFNTKTELYERTPDVVDGSSSYVEWTDDVSIEEYTYDYEDYGWRTFAPSDHPVRENHSVASVDGKLYVLSGAQGNTATKSVEEYTPSSDDWVGVSDIPKIHVSGGAAVVDSNIYMVGGSVDEDGAVHKYDPSTDSWSTVASLPEARLFPSVTSDGTYVYAIGGFDNANKLTTTTYRYDPSTDSWSTVTPHPRPHANGGAAFDGSNVYVVGGQRIGGETDTCFQYDQSTDSWTELPPMPTARSDISVVADDSYVYVIGGSNTTTVERYAIDSQSWWTLPDTDRLRIGGAATFVDGPLYDTQLFVVGSNWAISSVTSERYDTAALEGYGGLPPLLVDGLDSYNIDYLRDENALATEWITESPLGSTSDIAVRVASRVHGDTLRVAVQRDDDGDGVVDATSEWIETEPKPQPTRVPDIANGTAQYRILVHVDDAPESPSIRDGDISFIH